MELQWPLILFTTLVAWSAGVFGCQGVLALGGNAKKSQGVLTIVSVVLLAASGIAVFFHLQHWERIFNGFGHITSGITQELIAIVVFVVIAIIFFALLRKSEESGTVPKWCAILAIVISLILAAVCAHSYMMSARPAWNNLLEIASIVGASCILGPATCAIVMAAKGDELECVGRPALVGTVIGAVCAIAYAIFIQCSCSLFTNVGYYSDPTRSTYDMINVGSTVSSQAPLLWVGAVVVGAIVPLICVFLAKRKGDAASWKIFGAVAVVTALIGAVCLRMAFYSMGLSVFMFY